jgi:hypothetical protein
MKPPPTWPQWAIDEYHANVEAWLALGRSQGEAAELAAGKSERGLRRPVSRGPPGII